MVRQEIELDIQGHGSRFRHHAFERRQTFSRREKKQKPSHPTPPRKWLEVNPSGYYLIEGFIIEGACLARGPVPINATQLSLSSCQAIETGLWPITKDLPSNGRSEEFETHWQEVLNERFKILWQRTLMDKGPAVKTR